MIPRAEYPSGEAVATLPHILRIFSFIPLEEPPGPAQGERKKADDGIDLIVCTANASYIHEQDNKDSRVWNSIYLVGGDESDFAHYRTEFIALGLNMLSPNGGLAGYAPIARGKGVRIEVSGRR